MTFTCKHTWWSSGKQANVHLTSSVVTTCHTPCHSPPRPAKHKHILEHKFKSISKHGQIIKNLYGMCLYLLQPRQAVCVVVRLAVRSVLSVSRVDAVRSRHVAVQWAVANQGKSLKGHHGVLA